MCGRYTLGVSPTRIAEAFELGEVPELSPRYNIAPSQKAPVIRTVDGARQLDLRRFGLVPFWAKDPKIGSRMINARAETLREKPAFRTALRRGRCLVPADGFYEWKPDGRRKQPFHLRREDHGVFAFAGLCDRWHRDEPDEIRSFAIVTADAAGVVRDVHARMPVIVPEAAWKRWLDPEATTDEIDALLAPREPRELVAFEVSTRVNDPRVDDPGCREPDAGSEF